MCSSMVKFLVFILLFSSCNCDFLYNRDELQQLGSHIHPISHDLSTSLRHLDIYNGGRKARRGRRSVSGQKRKNDRGKFISCLLWNVEGLKSILNLLTDGIFTAPDVLMLTETFVTDDSVSVGNYYNFRSPAVSPSGRGRPSGGIQICAKRELDPQLMKASENYCAVSTCNTNLVCFYFKPTMNITDINAIISEAFSHLDGTKYTIIGGDFNARFDVPCVKFDELNYFMEANNFFLLNSTEPTYICHNGSSTIDLFYTDIPRSMGVGQTEVVHDSSTLLRKHCPVLTKFRQSTVEYHSEPKHSRIIDLDILQLSDGEAAYSALEDHNVNRAYQLVTEAIIGASPAVIPYTKRFSWFDSTCYALRKRVLELLRLARFNRVYLGVYATARKHYKITLRKKKQEFDEKEEVKLVCRAEKEPWCLAVRKKNPAAGISLMAWHTHFSKLLQVGGKPDFGFAARYFSSAHDDASLSRLNRDFDHTEVFRAISSMKNRKACGTDNVYYEHLKCSKNILCNFWAALYTTIFSTGVMIEPWKISILKVLHKKGDIQVCNNYRGIALLNNSMKIFTKMLARRLYVFTDALVPSCQYGFRTGKHTSGAINKLRAKIRTNLSQPRTPVYACFVDFQKAFDSVDRMLLISKLVSFYSVKGKFLKMLCSILTENFVLIDDGLRRTARIAQWIGVLQGDTLSPLLFTLFLGDLPGFIYDACAAVGFCVHILLYADDLVIYGDSLPAVQAAINSLHEWCIANSMTVNVSKTKMMKFRRGGRLARSDIAYFGGTQLEFVNQYEYLGVTFQSSLSVTKHLNRISTKCAVATHMLCNIRNCSIEAAKRLFRMKIQPIITYAMDTFWPELSVANFGTIDKIKATFFKQVLCLSMNASNTKTLLMIDEPHMSEELHIFGTSQHLIARRLKLIRKKSEVEDEFFDSLVFSQSNWMLCNALRHPITRFSLHGFHHLICQNKCYCPFSCNNQCILCGDVILSAYHLLNCRGNNRSLKDWASL